MMIKEEITMTYGEFAKYMIDKFGMDSYTSNLTDVRYFIDADLDNKYDIKFEIAQVKLKNIPRYYFHKDYVLVEIENELTEDTKIENLVEYYEVNGIQMTNIYSDKSIDDIENDNSKAFYILNDNNEMTLIWTRDERLITNEG